MYLAIITLPLLGSIISGFFGRKVGVTGSHIITSSSVILATILATISFIEVGINNIPVSLQVIRWIDSESLDIYWGFNFDSLTVSMLIPVLIVSSLVHLYSISYMNGDPHNQRFFSYLSLFTFMMVILVTSNNYLLMFVGWEGVGICSYLLVSFWFTRIAANQSSISALITNRVGDCFLTIGMFALLWSYGNIDYSTVFALSPYMNESLITLIGVCILIGAMAKSSQIGLHVWLPMAMEGPTPVSALIHAATMVTAGVYLLIRSSPLIEYSSTILLLCLWIGAITTVFSSLIGLFQQDIKKVIAYSTMSQLGMMVIAIGLSSYHIALFHLVNHAFYKALLFLGAGAVIHAVSDNQDFRKYGGLRQFLPLTYSVMLIASLSLVAFPFMTGFYSKDLILESAYGKFVFSSVAVYYIATVGAMFTTLYSIKVLYLTFITSPNGPVVNYNNAHEGDIFLSLPLVILAIFSVLFGFSTKDLFIGLGSDFFSDNSIFIHPANEIMLDTEFSVPTLYKLLPLILTLSLSVITIIICEFTATFVVYFKLTNIGYKIFGFFNQRFLIELIYNKYITDVIFKLGSHTTKILDRGSIEYVGPYGLQRGLNMLSFNLSKLDTGVVTTYSLYILLGLIFYMITYSLPNNNELLLIILVSLILNINNNSHKEFYTMDINLKEPTKHVLNSNSLYLLTFKRGFKSCTNLRISTKRKAEDISASEMDEPGPSKKVRTVEEENPNTNSNEEKTGDTATGSSKETRDSGYLNSEAMDTSSPVDVPDESGADQQEANVYSNNDPQTATVNSANSESESESESASESDAGANAGPNNNMEDETSSVEDEGYMSDPDLPFFDEGADGMSNQTPVREVPNYHIREYIESLTDINRHPERVGIAGDADPSNAQSRQDFLSREQDLRGELLRRKEIGIMPDSPGPSEGPCGSCEDENYFEQEGVQDSPERDIGDNQQDNTPQNNQQTGESSQQAETRPFRQNSSDVSADTEPASYGWDAED